MLKETISRTKPTSLSKVEGRSIYNSTRNKSNLLKLVGRVELLFKELGYVIKVEKK